MNVNRCARHARGLRCPVHGPAPYAPKRAVRFRLYMKPRKCPKWWPHDDNGKFKFVGVLRGGDGWVEGDGHDLTRAQVEAAKQLMRVDYPSAKFKVFQLL